MALNRYQHEIIQRGIVSRMAPRLSDPLVTQEERFDLAKTELQQSYTQTMARVTNFSFEEMGKNLKELSPDDYENTRNLIDGYMVCSSTRPLESRAEMFERAKTDLVSALAIYRDMAKGFLFADLDRVVS
tara:strand:- start:410 stop:799 length:390 start_codon:yes stop_codon:yes gene_type:complete